MAEPGDRPYDPARTRLHVVSGKGGTGKTTVAAALALALAAGGRRTLLCEVEGRQGIAQLFDVPQLPYQERKIAVGQDGGEVFALAVEAQGGADGVPRALLPDGPRREGARADGRRRLRHDGRAGASRRPADGQGLRGFPPPDPIVSRSNVMADPTTDRLVRLEQTRRSLHAVAELLLGGPQFEQSGSIELQVTNGGFGTAKTAGPAGRRCRAGGGGAAGAAVRPVGGGGRGRGRRTSAQPPGRVCRGTRILVRRTS